MPKSRRGFLASSFSALGAAGAVASAAPSPAATGAGRPFRLIFETEWNDIACADYPLTKDRWVEECIHPLAGTQVDTVLYNLCSSDGYVAELKSGELLMNDFDKLGDAWVWRYRENTKKLIEADANPPKLAVEYGHRLGLKVIPIVRMNDPHDQFFRYEVSRFKKNNPQLLIGHGTYPIDWEKGFKGLPAHLKKGMDSFTWGMFDFAHKEVRDHKLAIIEEFISRWDNDGISLDFDRDPRYFKESGSARHAALMTGLIREVKAILDRVGKQRGRKLYFHVRVIPKIEACHQRGLDVATWVKEGLIDAVTPGAGYMTVSLDLKPWLDLVQGRNCWIYPSCNHWRTTEETRAWASLMYQRGAHGLNLFNYGHLLHGHDAHTRPQSQAQNTVWNSEVHPDYYRALHEIHEPRYLEFKNKRYVLEAVPHTVDLEGNQGKTSRDYRAIDDIALPVVLKPGEHRVSFGFADDLEKARLGGAIPRVTLRLKITNYTAPDEFDVSVNGAVLPVTTRRTRAVFIMNNDTWVTFPVPAPQLRAGDNALAVSVRKLNPQISEAPVLSGVEILVEYNRGLMGKEQG
ncbi:MAG: hypothetical protein ACKV22_11170 [Bryobacteraceae bacterium]